MNTFWRPKLPDGQRRRSRFATAVPAALLLLLVFGVWQLYVSVKHVNEVILPSPWEVLHTLATNKQLLATNLVVTGEEIILGFVLGAVAGILLGIFITYSTILERALLPLVIASQVIPIFAIAPLLIIWFGFGITPKVLIAALIVFFPICVNQVEGLRSADEGAVSLIRSYGASEVKVFWMVRMPASVPFVLAGMQIGVTFSVIGAVIAEWVGAQKGLGELMLSAASLSNTTIVFAAIVTVAVVGVALFALVRIVGDMLFPWQAKSKG
jgi:ABC-type nitrate/sulfonate/bicarbonate transport system permease component